jgi:archaellum component FlaC
MNNRRFVLLYKYGFLGLGRNKILSDEISKRIRTTVKKINQLEEEYEKICESFIISFDEKSKKIQSIVNKINRLEDENEELCELLRLQLRFENS